MIFSFKVKPWIEIDREIWNWYTSTPRITMGAYRLPVNCMGMKISIRFNLSISSVGAHTPIRVDHIAGSLAALLLPPLLGGDRMPTQCGHFDTLCIMQR